MWKRSPSYCRQAALNKSRLKPYQRGHCTSIAEAGRVNSILRLGLSCSLACCCYDWHDDYICTPGSTIPTGGRVARCRRPGNSKLTWSPLTPSTSRSPRATNASPQIPLPIILLARRTLQTANSEHASITHPLSHIRANNCAPCHPPKSAQNTATASG